jgi:NDP-sugar pyrophosphorylase family protein
VCCINKKDESAFRYELRDLNVKFSVSEEPLGTVGELLVAKREIDDTFCLRYGDDLTEIDYKSLIDFHKKKQATATIAVTPQFRLPVGVVDIDNEGKIVKFSEKPILGKYIWTAIAVLEPRAVAYFKLGEDIATHALPKMIEAGEPVYAFINDKPWFDVGNIEGWRLSDAYYRQKYGGKELSKKEGI